MDDSVSGDERPCPNCKTPTKETRDNVLVRCSGCRVLLFLHEYRAQVFKDAVQEASEDKDEASPPWMDDQSWR